MSVSLGLLLVIPAVTISPILRQFRTSACGRIRHAGIGGASLKRPFRLQLGHFIWGHPTQRAENFFIVLAKQRGCFLRGFDAGREPGRGLHSSERSTQGVAGVHVHAAGFQLGH